jgi:hypothetical protein
MKSSRQSCWIISIPRLAKTVSFVTTISVLAAIAFFNACQAASDTARQLHYRVEHPVFGDIGTYTNTIEPAGHTTMIRTSVHLRVTALGVVLHREDAERTERWQDDRLVDFHGSTTINGEVIEVKGEARGDSFIITSPLGSVAAPATIRPSNPWSSGFLNSTTMMRTDTGKVEKVRISGGAAAVEKIDGTSVWTREYQVDGTIRYKVWIDRQNIPVLFTVDDGSGEIYFTLTR